MENSTTNLKERIPRQNDIYYMRYRDYFETTGINNNYYRYFVELVNVNDNKTWPLEECPKCSANLKANPPVVKYFKYDSTLSLFATIIGGLVLFSIIGIVIIAFLSYISAIITYAAILFIAFFLIMFVIIVRNSNKIQSFHCTKCNSLLYNNLKDKSLITKMHPNIFFRELEKIGDFRFKA